MGILSTLGMPIAAQLLAELWVGALRPFSTMRAYYGPYYYVHATMVEEPWWSLADGRG